jgi:hypothetical protein
MLENGKPVQLTSGQEVTITTDYAKPGNSSLIAMRCVSNASTSTSTLVPAAEWTKRLQNAGIRCRRQKDDKLQAA